MTLARFSGILTGTDMRNKTPRVIRHILKLPARVGAILLIVAALVILPTAQTFADSFDEQIKALQQEVSKYEDQAGALRAAADTLQNNLAALNAEMSALQKDIDLKEAELAKINDTIKKTEVRLDNQMKLLAANLRSMYLEDQVSSLEMIASSKSISDFIDKQEYRNKIRDQVHKNIGEIKQLKIDLAKQKADAEHVLADQKAQKAVLADKQSQQQNLLAQTQGQEAAYQNLTKQKNSEIAGLRAAQAAANRAAGGKIVPGDPGHGGYPAKWDAPVPQDSRLDNWGMYNRECVSYTAYRVWASGRYMPYWGGHGDAKLWDNNAVAEGIPVSSSPKAGDIAISNAGPYGHAMYVEAVLGGGQIYVSQYNYGFTGEYSEMTISTSGLVFIHF